MELEFGYHRFTFSGSYSDLIHNVQESISSNLGQLPIVEGVRFVGSNSLQRKIEECRVIDLDVQVLIRSRKFSDYQIVLNSISHSVEFTLPDTGDNLASISTIHGLYKPLPLEKGSRLFIHVVVADKKRYLEIDPSIRYSWKKYKPSLGSFTDVDNQSISPTLNDVFHGPEGIVYYIKCIDSGYARLGILDKSVDQEVKETVIEVMEPSILHELFTSSVVYNYRNLCRALGILNEKLNNFELIKKENGVLWDAHNILTPIEVEALEKSIKSKYRLRNGMLQEVDPINLSILKNNSLTFLKSISERFDILE